MSSYLTRLLALRLICRVLPRRCSPLSGCDLLFAGHRLERSLHETLEESLAPGTRKTLNTALKHFRSFEATMPNRPAFVPPAFAGDLSAGLHNEYTLMLFAMFLVDVHLSGRPKQASTVLSYCSLVRTHVAVELGLPLTSGTPRWRKLAKALKRRHQSERRLCQALRASHLVRGFVGSLASDDDVWSVNRFACAAVGWQLLARPRELINLRRSDVHWLGDHWVIMLTPLKKRSQQSPVPIPIAPGDNSGCDAFRHISRLLLLDPVEQQHRSRTPLFRRQGRALTLADVTSIVRDIVLAAGEQTANTFSGRSIRVGGATELACMGVPQLTIQLLGRWDSEVYTAYTRATRGQALRISSLMGRAATVRNDPTLEAVFNGYTQAA